MPDFKYTYTSDDHNFPSKTIFDYEEWKKDVNYLKIVRVEENIDLVGNRPYYVLNDDFHITILAKYESDEKCEKLKALIPHAKDMLHICIVKGVYKPKPIKVKQAVAIKDYYNHDHIVGKYLTEDDDYSMNKYKKV